VASQNRGETHKRGSRSRGAIGWGLEVYPQACVVIAFLKLDATTVAIEEGFTRDVRKIGHFGTGDLEVSMRTLGDCKTGDRIGILKSSPILGGPHHRYVRT
jgi:hypothetical protein